MVIDPNPNPNPRVRIHYRIVPHYRVRTGYRVPSLEVCLLGSTELSRSTDPGQGLRPIEPTRRLPTLLS